MKLITKTQQNKFINKKVILNKQEIFAPFCDTWIPVILNVLLDYGKEINNGMNYFIVDICTTIIIWGEQDAFLLYSDKQLFSKVINFLIKNCYHESKTVLNNNLLILKMITELWQRSLDISLRSLFDTFSDPDPENKQNLIGIQLMSIVMTNDIDNCFDAQQFNKSSLTNSNNSNNRYNMYVMYMHECL